MLLVAALSLSKLQGHTRHHRSYIQDTRERRSAGLEVAKEATAPSGASLTGNVIEVDASQLHGLIGCDCPEQGLRI